MIIISFVCHLHNLVFFLLLSRMTGEDGKEVIMEIERKLSRLFRVLKVCLCLLNGFYFVGKRFYQLTHKNFVVVFYNIYFFRETVTVSPRGRGRDGEGDTES